ncbi:hypothetical protein CERSUDRAFT_94433 [Gelatoporia subvermispora B]|uniref:Uncharacterized protein n=1 Tax=Ceriporiopsis subvermispora (strain B) TaxID=914234 RepID=M2RF50_CERS8|nr:hypothetical protein CERSUDRAFT_94433 [Gelatoporia subvermispora B]
MPRKLSFKKVSKNMGTIYKHLRPSKTTVVTISDGAQTAVQFAHVVANATSITPLKTATGIASAITTTSNTKQAKELAEKADFLLTILNEADEAHMSNTAKVALTSLVGTLQGVEKDVAITVTCGRVKKVLQYKEIAEKIKECTNRLGVGCDAFQAAMSVVNHSEIMRQSSAEQTHFERIEDSITKLWTTCDRIATDLGTSLAISEQYPSTSTPIWLECYDPG